MKYLEINGGEVSGPALDVEHLIRLGSAFGGRHRQVLTGCWSSDPTAQARCMALTAGMMSAGTRVLEGGCLPQPVLTLLAKECATPAVCMVLPDSVRFRAEDPGWLADFRGGIGHYDLPPAGGAPALKPMSVYFRKLAQVVDTEAVRSHGFAVRLTAHGAAEDFSAKLLEKLNCRIVDETAPNGSRTSTIWTRIPATRCGAVTTSRPWTSSGAAGASVSSVPAAAGRSRRPCACAARDWAARSIPGW